MGELGYAVSIRHATERVAALSKTGADPILLAVADGQVLGLLAAHLCRMLQYASPIVGLLARRANLDPHFRVEDADGWSRKENLGAAVPLDHEPAARHEDVDG